MGYFGFDVSEYQGNIDWMRVPDKYSFTIIRAGFGVIPNQTDNKFAENMELK